MALSGGVDSALAAALLSRDGWSVTGLHMLLCGDGEAEAARSAAEHAGIPLEILDLRAEFRELVQAPFAAAWGAGKTPNPCIACNRTVKFGLLQDRAAALGLETVATGHYARTVVSGGRTLLLRGADGAKDQSYFLARTAPERLARAVFPLGELTKDRVRALAAELGLPAASRKDSQDVCFLPGGDYAAWLEERGFCFTAGRFVTADGRDLGPHKGAERYTLGQRRGLGIALGSRAYVTGRRGADLVVGPEEDLFGTRVRVTDLNYLASDPPKAPTKVFARLRYRDPGAECVLHPLSETEALLEFCQPRRMSAPGQTAVCYDGDCVVCGGEIVGPF